ncbi:MAG: anaerobic ribonucleoside-triphosphate reductase activating protein [Candidatus Moraniibacteriota bacterium]|nr:MAG: anaerobic ribonucleoside-triphosphate reductase activating protein [Candidatus Moranbacteria bacterium]
MLISGIQQFTLLDYPNKVAAIIFTPGCNMRCRFCHNKEFVLPEEITKMRPYFITEDAVLRFLIKRKGKLDGVVISGGEPTLQPDLIPFITKVRDMGFLIKLDTNGALPDILMTCVREKLVDYVAMDVKTLPEKYPKLVGDMIDPENIRKSIAFLKRGHVPYEFRTTIIDGIHTTSLMQDIATLLAGSDALYLQKFRPDTTLDPAFEKKKPISDDTMHTFVTLCKNAGITHVDIRT